MKASTLKLCLPITAMTAQQTAVSLLIPPFLDSHHYPLSAIGSLISVAPILALTARLPAGLAYRPNRARALMVAALLIMSGCTFLYSYAVEPLQFALVQAFNGFFFGAASTTYLAFYVDHLAPDEDRHHAMGYYTGCLAVGYSMGGFAAGYIADKFGYEACFHYAAWLGLVCIVLLFVLSPRHVRQSEVLSAGRKPAVPILTALKGIVDPTVASIIVVALYLNLLHQMGNAFVPLYGLAIGLSLTQVGVIRAFYSLCNAVTRPFSGSLTKSIGYHTLSRFGLPLQSMFIILVPFVESFSPLLVVFLLAGFVRAIVIVANSISMVEDVDMTRVSRGVISALYNAAGDIGNILGPSMGGLIATFTGVAHLFFVGPLLITTSFVVSLWACRFIRPARHS
ncbi:MAG TPA: MFS transporter [Candidatus Binatia bacterium]|jgi:predicted MFS family arabinose efflux permease